jgi:hypothetical protein
MFGSPPVKLLLSNPKESHFSVRFDMSPVIELFDKIISEDILSIRLENLLISNNEIPVLDKSSFCNDFCVYIQDGKFGP